MAIERYSSAGEGNYFSIAETAAELELQPGRLSFELDNRESGFRIGTTFLGLTVEDYERLRLHYGVKGPATVPEAAGFPGLVSSKLAQEELFARGEFEHPEKYRARRARLNVEFEDVLKKLGVAELRIKCLNEAKHSAVLKDTELHEKVRAESPPPDLKGPEVAQWRQDQETVRRSQEEERAASRRGQPPVMKSSARRAVAHG